MATRLFARSAKRFLRARDGGVAIIFGLTVLPILGVVGLAIDFGQILVKRNIAQMAADAAALQASGTARKTLATSQLVGNFANAAAKTEGEQAGLDMMNAYALKHGISYDSANIDVTISGLNVSAKADYSISNKNTLARIFGVETFTTQGTARAAAAIPPFIDIHMALDLSPSMGVASNVAEMVKMYNASGTVNTGTGPRSQKVACVFACHALQAGWTETFYQIGKRYNIRFRIDDLRNATLSMLSLAKSGQFKKQYRFSLNGLSATSAGDSLLTTIAPLSGDLDGLQAAVRTIEMVSAAHLSVSYIDEPMRILSQRVNRSGAGETTADARQFVLLITDGVRDVPKRAQPTGCLTTSSDGDRCFGVSQGDWCKTLKDKQVTLGIVYTTYLPLPADPSYPSGPLQVDYQRTLVNLRDTAGKNTAEKIRPTLETCASPGWFFEASDDVAIETAVRKLFEMTGIAPTLTQ